MSEKDKEEFSKEDLDSIKEHINDIQRLAYCFNDPKNVGLLNSLMSKPDFEFKVVQLEKEDIPNIPNEPNFQYKFKCNCGQIFKSDSIKIVIESFYEHNCSNNSNTMIISCEFCNDAMEITKITKIDKKLPDFIGNFIENHFCKEMKKIKEVRETEIEEKEISNEMKSNYDIYFR